MAQPPPIPPQSPPPLDQPVALVAADRLPVPANRSGIRKQATLWSKIPKMVKLLLLVMALAIAVPSCGAIGIVGFFGGIGIPLILVVAILAFGAVGVTTVIRNARGHPTAKVAFDALISRIAHDEALRRMKREMRDAMTASPVEPRKQPTSQADAELRQQLLRMDPFAFERHVLSFFQDMGLVAWVTAKTNDAGADGFARHAEGLIVVQCKRYGPTSTVGRPAVQQFKGVIEENDAWRGFIVTTSQFTAAAEQSATGHHSLRLIDMDTLVAWHRTGVVF